MTKEEILTLPAGRKLDAMIAEKVMNWYVSPGGLCDSDRRPGDVFLGDTCEIIPSFSMWMLDAWRVFLKLPHEQPRHQNFVGHVAIGRSERGWTVFYDHGDDGQHAIASAATPELAICRASLILCYQL